jgi:hypothetical protein
MNNKRKRKKKEKKRTGQMEPREEELMGHQTSERSTV